MNKPAQRAAIFLGSFVQLALSTIAFAANPSAQTPEATLFRSYANGAGPTAIFRLGTESVSGNDVFGVVDPVLWRIRYFELKPPAAGSAALANRIRFVWDCFLPPTFRVWRAHQFESRVVLQSQPEIKFLPDSKPLPTRKLSLDSSQSTIASILSRQPVGLEDKPEDHCASDGGLKGAFDPAVDSASMVTGGEDKAFVVTSRDANAQPGFARKPITISPQGAILSSIRELERSSNGDRHFLVTTRSSAYPGFANAVVKVIRRSSDGSRDGTLRLNLGLTRVKSGQRAVAVTSTGEVLVLGAGDHATGFQIHLCKFISTVQSKGLCTLEAAPKDASATPSPEAGGEPGQDQVQAKAVSKKDLWSDAAWYATRTYRIDASVRPDGCARWEERRCFVNGKAWQPISELRYANGVSADGIYEKVGVPYAQSQVGKLRPVPGNDMKQSLPNPIPLLQTNGSKHVIVSDIDNTDIVSDPNFDPLGIDCSALVSALWRRKPPQITTSFIIEANDHKGRRVAEFGKLKMGDALAINLADHLNHIVLFRERRKASSVDTSRAVLVFESSSSCGGVCWSLYDESFFHGWALIRNTDAKNGPSKFERIPLDYAKWKEMFAR